LVEETGVYLEKPPTNFISKCCIEYTPHDKIESSPMIPVLLNFHCLKFLFSHNLVRPYCFFLCIHKSSC
jgi:hypothetical protein